MIYILIPLILIEKTLNLTHHEKEESDGGRKGGGNEWKEGEKKQKSTIGLMPIILA